jgi:hypothetical protein
MVKELARAALVAEPPPPGRLAIEPQPPELALEPIGSPARLEEVELEP